MRLSFDEQELPQVIELFHTPKSMEGLTDWIEQLSGSERVVATTAAMMMNNLLAQHLKSAGKKVI